MKSWEFLLQKEGDRTWLPLENQTVEILEGRYRVVARTPCAQEEVDIYVSFVSSEDEPPKRRIQQRSHAANDDGLLAILPFTPFRPGHWELRCRPHEASGGLGRPWQSQIQLQVLPQDDMAGDGDLFGWDQPQDDALESRVTTSDDSEGIDSSELDAEVAEDPTSLGMETVTDEQSRVESDATLGVEAEQAMASTPAVDLASAQDLASDSRDTSAAELDPATASEEDIQRLAAEMSQMVMESVAEADPSVSKAVEADHAAVEAVVPPVSPAQLPNPDFVAADASQTERVETSPVDMPPIPRVSIVLEETVVVMDGDRQVTVRGQITQLDHAERQRSEEHDVAISNANSQTVGMLLPSELVLTTELRDPSTTEVWASQRESFHQAIAPISFVSQLRLPIACRTQLFLGNVTLWRVQASGELERLLSQDFNAMATVDELLEHAYQPEQATSQVVDEGAVSNLKQQAASNFLVTKFGAQPKIAKGNVQINTELLSLLKPTSAGSKTQASSSRTQAASPGSDDAASRRESRSKLELPSFANRRPLSIPQADRLANELADDSMGLVNDATSRDGYGEAGDLFDFQREALQGDQFSGETLEAEVVNSVEASSDFADNPLEGTTLGQPSNNLESGEENPFALPLDGSLGGLEGLEGNEDARSPAPTFDRSPGDFAAGDDLSDALGMAPALEADDLRGPSSLDLRPETALTTDVVAAEASADGGFVHEVVVDDEEPVLPNKLAWMQPSPKEAFVDEDLLVPNPELIVPEVVLVRGEALRIQVRVAQEPARLCARVWLLDRQSRTLLGEPKWITAFLPLGEDWLEANVDLVVPDGSIELQVEAIAVEPITQRESRKVSVRRKVSLETDDQSLENW